MLPRLLRVVVVRSGELDRVLQILVVHVQEGERRTLLLDRVERRHRPGAGHTEPWKRDLAHVPDPSPTGDVDTGADLRERRACLERAAFSRCQHVTEIVAHRFEDADAREQLEVHADAEQPRRVGEVTLLGDVVAHERTGVERGLVAADGQHRGPRVIRVTRIVRPRSRGLARGVGANDAVDDAHVQRTEVPDVARVDVGDIAGDRDPVVGDAPPMSNRM